jgi:hypothetical protein
MGGPPPASPPPPPRKLKVLCLHGFTQNAETFRQRTGSIRKQLKSRIDFVFVDAPHDASGAFGESDASSLGGATGESESDAGPRAWWLVGENAVEDAVEDALAAASSKARDDDENADENDAMKPPPPPPPPPVRPATSRQMRGWDATATRIADAVRTLGPFDGVLGFSQGASAAALALALVPSLRETVAFAILFSGFAPLDPTASAALFGPREDARDDGGGGGGGGGGGTLRGVRSLHVWGAADGMVSRERFEALRGAFRAPEPETFEHDGGHGVPFSAAFRAALKAFALESA